MNNTHNTQSESEIEIERKQEELIETIKGINDVNTLDYLITYIDIAVNIWTKHK